MKWRAYPGYKPSGVEWLGEVPEHWRTLRLKYTTSINDEVLKENTDPNYEIQYVDISSVDAVEGIKKREFMRFEEAPSRARRRVRDGDVIVSTVRTYLRAIAPINNPEENFIVSTGFAVIRPQGDVHSNFAAYALRAPYFVDAVVARSVGVSYPAVNASEIGDLSIALPPDSEQRAIAAFLDRETGRLDALMEKKRRQIELLQEKRTALISHAVTRGLDPPTVKMKDSGVDWLGHIPAHWESRRLKFLISEPLKYGANESAEIDDPDLPRYIRITDIKEGGSLRDDTFKSLPEDIADPFLLKHGDILLARSGATAGKTFMYQDSWGRACYAGYLIRLRANIEEALPEFLSYFTNSSVYWGWLSSVFIQATIQNVSAEKYANMVVTSPPIEEQKEIVVFLDHETAKINTLITKVQESIDRLKEYRTALISAAVTGRIDVRGEGA
jgi:restriction endonuclease S subunit